MQAADLDPSDSTKYKWGFAKKISDEAKLELDSVRDRVAKDTKTISSATTAATNSTSATTKPASVSSFMAPPPPPTIRGPSLPDRGIVIII